jgi:HicA toxin of bacterial toxin-antitoxin,
MNSKHAKTLNAVFADPVSPSIQWAAIEGLFMAVGCKVIEGSGSRVRFEKDGVVVGLHRPHPSKDAKRHHVRDAREYLIKLGIRP